MTPRLEALLVCENASAVHWELPLQPSGVRVHLVGWILRPAEVDAGVPPLVANLLAEALSRWVTVSYFAYKPETGLLRHFSHSPPMSVRHTRDPLEVARLFDDEYFHWSQRAQAAFLSRPHIPPPALAIKDLDNALAGRNYAAFRARNIAALFLPGVDGDVAGFYALDVDIWRSVRDALQQATIEHHAEWRVLDEPAFTVALR